MVPLLPTFCAIAPRETIATSLLTIFLVSLNNTVSFQRQKLVRWEVVVRIVPFTALGSFVAGYITRWIPVVGLKFILGFIMLFFVWRGLRRSQSISVQKGRQIHLVGMGLFGGFASGISGLGSGIIISPLLMATKLVDHWKVSPTTNAIMVITSSFGVMAFIGWPQPGHPFVWGLVQADKALQLVAGAWLASFFVRRHQSRLPENWRKMILLGVLFLLSVKVFWEAFHLLR